MTGAAERLEGYRLRRPVLDAGRGCSERSGRHVTKSSADSFSKARGYAHPETLARGNTALETTLRITRTVVTSAGTVVLVALIGLGPPVAAQSTIGSVRFGVFGDYPDDFEGGGCDGSYVGMELGLARSIAPSISLEGSVTWTGSAATSCALANDALSLPAPMDGATYTRTILDESIAGETFLATRVGALIAPFSGALAPRLRVGVGRLWSKQLWTWMGGAGVRYGWTRHGVTLDLERWHLGYDVTQEGWIYREGGPDELQSRESIERRPRPWFLRVGWDFAIGD